MKKLILILAAVASLQTRAMNHTANSGSQKNEMPSFSQCAATLRALSNMHSRPKDNTAVHEAIGVIREENRAIAPFAASAKQIKEAKGIIQTNKEEESPHLNHIKKTVMHHCTHTQPTPSLHIKGYPTELIEKRKQKVTDLSTLLTILNGQSAIPQKIDPIELLNMIMQANYQLLSFNKQAVQMLHYQLKFNIYCYLSTTQSVRYDGMHTALRLRSRGQ
ncbi:MAG: hypothetical protein WCE21_02980 [Candidatus Babeliales bacterium]